MNFDERIEVARGTDRNGMTQAEAQARVRARGLTKFFTTTNLLGAEFEDVGTTSYRNARPTRFRIYRPDNNRFIGNVWEAEGDDDPTGRPHDLTVPGDW